MSFKSYMRGRPPLGYAQPRSRRPQDTYGAPGGGYGVPDYRTFQLAGLHANGVLDTTLSIAKGTPTPNTAVRATAAYAERVVSGAPYLYALGSNELRCTSRLDLNGEEVSGYLAEIAATNVLEASKDHENATYWGVVGSPGISANSQVSPTGDTDANRLTGLDGSNYVSNPGTGFTADAIMAVGIWIKRVSTTGTFRIFNDIAAGLGSWSIDASLLPDAWVRITIANLATYGTEDSAFKANGSGAANLLLYSPTGSFDVDVWNCQMEESGSKMVSSDIVTGAGVATRNKDELQYKGDDGNLGGVGSEKRGTLSFAILGPAHTAVARKTLVCLSDGGSSADKIEVSINPSGGVVEVDTRATAGNAGDANGSTNVLDGYRHFIQVKWRDNNLRLYVDGALEAQVLSCDMPDDLDRIDVGQNESGAQQAGVIISDPLIEKAD